MISAQRALRLHLLEPSDLKTLVGVHIYWPELPAGTSGAGRRIVFRVDGGVADSQLPLHEARINFRCYGTSADDADRVYGELHDRLVRTKNFIVTDTYANPDEYVAFYRMAEDGPPRPLQDPGTGWYFSFGVWTATVATTSVPAPTFPS